MAFFGLFTQQACHDHHSVNLPSPLTSDKTVFAKSLFCCIDGVSVKVRGFPFKKALFRDVNILTFKHNVSNSQLFSKFHN